MITTATRIKHIENSLEVLNLVGLEMDLETILAEEFEQGFASDISNGY